MANCRRVLESLGSVLRKFNLITYRFDANATVSIVSVPAEKQSVLSNASLPGLILESRALLVDGLVEILNKRRNPRLVLLRMVNYCRYLLLEGTNSTECFLF